MGASMGGQDRDHKDAMVQLGQTIQGVGESLSAIDLMVLGWRQIFRLKEVLVNFPLPTSYHNEVADLESLRCRKALIPNDLL